MGPFWVLQMTRPDGVTVYPGYPYIQCTCTCTPEYTPQNGGRNVLRFYGSRFDAVFGDFCMLHVQGSSDPAGQMAHQILRFRWHVRYSVPDQHTRSWFRMHVRSIVPDPARQMVRLIQRFSQHTDSAYRIPPSDLAHRSIVNPARQIAHRSCVPDDTSDHGPGFHVISSVSDGTQIQRTGSHGRSCTPDPASQIHRQSGTSDSTYR